MKSLHHSYILNGKEYCAEVDITRKGEFFCAVSVDDNVIELRSYAELEALYKAMSDLINNINHNTEED